MKKIIIFLFAALTLLSTFSCKNEYTCYCYNYTENNDTTFSIQAIDNKRAVDICEEQILGHNALCVYQ